MTKAIDPTKPRLCKTCWIWKDLRKFFNGQKAYRTECEACRGRRRRAQNPKLWNERVRRWRDKNPERVREYSLKVTPLQARSLRQRRLARLAAAPGGAFNICRPDYLARSAFYGDRCCVCGVEGALHMEHGTPVSRGGSNFAANIRPICKNCNSRKSARTWAEHLLHPYSRIDLDKLHPALRAYRELLLARLQRAAIPAT